jgi:hypothetical protein
MIPAANYRWIHHHHHHHQQDNQRHLMLTLRFHHFGPKKHFFVLLVQYVLGVPLESYWMIVIDSDASLFGNITHCHCYNCYTGWPQSLAAAAA